MNLLRRYGFQIKDLLNNIFGDYSSEENNEEISDENQQEVVAEILEQWFDIYKNWDQLFLIYKFWNVTVKMSEYISRFPFIQ